MTARQYQVFDSDQKCELGGRASCFSWQILFLLGTGIVWALSLGVLSAKEFLPAMRVKPSGIYEKIFTRLSPFEELWYSFYYGDAFIGGLRVYYEVAEKGFQPKAILRTTLWCDPFQAEGMVQVNERYDVETLRWDFSWRGQKGFLSGARAGLPGTLVWKGMLGARSINLGFPESIVREEFPVIFPYVEEKMLRDGWNREYRLSGDLLRSVKFSLRTARAFHPGGVRQYVCALKSGDFQMSVLADTKGLVERVDFPGGFSLRRGGGEVVLKRMKDQARAQSRTPAMQDIIARMDALVKLLFAPEKS